MSFVLVCSVALFASALTLFSGFGLGTILMPAFLPFFPLEIAIAATAIVHLANNLFKLALVGRHANWRIVVLFGVPAILTAVLGALLLNSLGKTPPLWTYSLGASEHRIAPLSLVIGVLMMAFAVIELLPQFEKLAFAPRYVPLGGVISGFFGGLSGHQGALRAAFLVRLGLSRDAFIGTSVVCAVIVDLARLSVYATQMTDQFHKLRDSDGIPLVIAGSLAAFAGAYIGNRLVKKVTMHTIRWIVGIMLFTLGAALAAGLLPEK